MELTGKSFPKFELPDQNNKIWSNNDLKNKWNVIYLYPKDMTPGCTIEAHDFSDFLEDFEKFNTRIIGVSPDDTASHKEFCEKDRISFPLLSDIKKDLVKKLDSWIEKTIYGKKLMSVDRSTWIVNPNGKIVREWRNVNVPGHVKVVLETLKRLVA